MTEDRPVDNAPYLTHKHGDLTIEGYSRAAVQSYWRVPELKAGFDLGAHPWEFMGTPNWFISHAHLDHIAALPVYVARRRMMKMEPPKVFVPAESAEDIRRLLLAMQRLDRGRQACELIPLEPGRRGRSVAGACGHGVGHVAHDSSRGYMIWDRRHKLKAEFHGLPGEKIRDLRLSGTAVTEEVRLPILAVTATPARRGWMPARMRTRQGSYHGDEFRPCGPSSDKIHKYGHMHLDDFLERADRFENELIVAGHFSTRYHPREVFKMLEKNLPEGLREKLRVWL